jgi:hypothetical protein
MNSGSEQTSRNDGSANKHSQKPSTSKPSSNAAGRQGRNSTWEDRLRELADYCKEHGHCNVPTSYSENVKLAKWVGKQRSNYKLQLEGKKSPMTTFRIQELESLGFEWDCHGITWEHYMIELANYRKIHGHCNVPKRFSENTKLGQWVSKQRNNYRLHLEVKTSSMTTFRIQELESLGFEWDCNGITWEHYLIELTNYRKIHGHCNVPQIYSENIQFQLTNWVTNQRTDYRLHLEGKKSPMTTFRIQKLESLGFEWKPYNSRRKVETPKKRKLDDDAANPVAAEPLRHRHTVFTHALLLGDGSTGNSTQATPEKTANAPQDRQHTPQDEVFHSDNILSEVELELIWLGEESMYCLSCPEFQFDFIYEYATSALKVELRKLSRADQSETGKLKEIVRMNDWLVSRRLDFVRKDVRMMLRRGFRRQRMRIVIAELRLMRRQEPERQFPATIPSRT